MITSVGSTVNVNPSTVIVLLVPPPPVISAPKVVFVAEPIKPAVVPAMMMPKGPIVTISPSMVVVVGTEPGPMENVFPLITACEGDKEKVRSPSVTMEYVGLGRATVVVASPMPFGPMLIVCPFITVVVEGVLGPMINVWPAMTAADGPTEKVKLPAVTVEKDWGKATVVVAKPTPLGPMLMVWPLMTVVIGELPGPMVKVLPSMTAADGPIENVSPPAVTVEKVGSDA